MVRFRHILSGTALAASLASPVTAQSPYGERQPTYGTPYASTSALSDADQLAQQMRQVAANPTDIYALLSAARLSLKVGDTDAAAALYTRADRVNPMNPQVKAGMARLLVQAGRPGEALRRFQDAERLGARWSDFGPDRALAYDLIGEQQRAQREYRALLQLGPDEETTRRYALSLGIAGLKDPALELLEPLNRRGDRGAWRARAFVLAMNGDRPGAERIANTMMPPGMAQGLAPFFDRLPRLSTTERAFAVNFGEVRASPTRLADARLVPPLPALSPEPDPFANRRNPVQVAARDDDGKRNKRKSRKEREAEAKAARAARTAYVAPLPPPPAPTAVQLAALTATRFPSSAYSGRVTVLPPPPSAYRAPDKASADDDEPDAPVTQPSVVAARRPPVTTMVAAAPIRTQPPAAQSFVGVPMGQASTFRLVAPPPPPPSPAPAPVAVTAAPSSAIVASVVSTPPVTGASLSATSTAQAAAVSSSPPVASVASLPASEAPPTSPPAPGVSTGLTVPAVTSVASTTTPPPATTLAANTVPAPGLSVASGVSEPTGLDPDPAVAAPVTTAVSGPAASNAAITPETGAPPPPKGASGDAVLAAIVAGISVPESEMIATQPVPTPVKADPPPPAPAMVAKSPSEPAAVPPATTQPRTKLLANIEKKAEVAEATEKPDPALPKKDSRGRFVDDKGKPLLDARGRAMGPKAAAEWKAEFDRNGGFASRDLPKRDARGRFVDDKGKPLLDRRGRPLDPKAAAAWKAADDKKADAAKDQAKGEPARIWVQVAGGADESTLAREWGRVSASAPSLKGKQGWTTPLRATNRILTGPFRSSGEAMALVNQLKKEGVSGFMFTSDAGQKITRLGGK